MTKEQLIKENETLKEALKQIILLASESHRKGLEGQGIECLPAYQCGEMAATAYAAIAGESAVDWSY